MRCAQRVAVPLVLPVSSRGGRSTGVHKAGTKTVHAPPETGSRRTRVPAFFGLSVTRFVWLSAAPDGGPPGLLLPWKVNGKAGRRRGVELTDEWAGMGGWRVVFSGFSGFSSTPVMWIYRIATWRLCERGVP